MRARSVPRLILVDGFAGSGKSTTAQRLCLLLRAAGRRAEWFHEHQAAHPIFCYDEVEELLAVAPDAFEDQILARWSAFARSGSGDAAAIRILEGSFLQLTVGVMLSMNLTSARIVRVLREIDRLLAPLDPALIHLFHRDVRAGLLAIRDHRGAYWLEGMTTIVGRSAYGRRHGVRDVEGLIGFYRKQQAIIEAALPKLTLRRLGIEIGRGAWGAYATRMSAFLAMDRRNIAATAHDLRRCPGSYRSRIGSGRMVTTDGAALYLHETLQPAQRLLPAGAGRFWVESLPIELRFTHEQRGRFGRFAVDNRLMNARPAAASFTRIEERPPSR